jgi:hypothetical protein
VSEELRAEQGRIETLLACRGARGADRARAEQAGVEWTPDLGDPECTKNLRTLLGLAVAADGLCERTGLMSTKEAQDLPLRARRELKARAVTTILPLILVTTCLFGVALALVADDVESVLLAAAAGLAGAALGGLVELRDKVTRGAQVREFMPFYAGQLLIGVTAGLLVFAADASGLVAITGGAAGVATVAFAVGFSEAAFVRLLARVGEIERITPTGGRAEGSRPDGIRA